MKKRSIYVPGLLSLLLLFPLLVYKLSAWHIFDKNYVMEVTWYSPVENRFMQAFPPMKEYTDITLTGDAVTDKVKIDSAKVLIQEMVTLFDTTRGVHIIFGDTAKYQSFVEILDYCDQQEGLGYAPHESNFWIVNRLKKQEQKKFLSPMSCIALSRVIDPEEKKDCAWAFAYGVDPTFWPIGLLFVLLVIVNLKRRKM